MTRWRRPRPSSPWRFLVVATSAVACVTHATSAVGHERGIAVAGCDGCHGGGAIEQAMLSLVAEPATFAPGDLVTFTLGVRRSSIRVAGAYVVTGGVGAFQPLPGEGLAASGKGLSHTAPKAAVDGSVTFRFGWRAPSSPGAVSFGVAALAGNGDRASSGDAPGAANFHWVFGCTGREFFVDLDRDGYGSKALGSRLGCADDPTPEGYASVDGDCNENDEQAYPGALEVCNKRDDDCDGQIDEGAPPVTLWPDTDGDGFYQRQTGTPKTGCGDVAGYAATGGDCDELDPSVNPQAPETCNQKDDDCDGQVDEQARPACGVGWCARYSPSCDAADCRPGPPAVETCNSFDDDCDGVADEEACGPGLVCSNSECIASSPEAPQGSAGSAPAPSPSAPKPSAKPSASCTVKGATSPGTAAAWLLAAVTLLGALGCRRRPTLKPRSGPDPRRAGCDR